jgi:hypothetical protein
MKGTDTGTAELKHAPPSWGLFLHPRLPVGSSLGVSSTMLMSADVFQVKISCTGFSVPATRKFLGLPHKRIRILPSTSKKKEHFFLGILKVNDEKSRIRIRNPVYGSKDPDRYPY